MIPRIIEKSILEALRPGASRKVVCLFGPRQAGKTTLLTRVGEQLGGRALWLNGDFHDDRSQLVPERAALERLVRGVDHVFIDEAQNVTDIGLVLKLLHDHFPALRIAASGSSSFDLRRKTGEPLTGRQRVFTLFPLSFAELSPSGPQLRGTLESCLIHGCYPEVVGLPSAAERDLALRQLAGDYLLKDLTSLVELDRSRMNDLLRLLAFQVGSEVSLSELGRAIRADVKTVDRYLGLLEDAFVILRLGGYSRNLRKEIARSRKVYFLDLGVRNAVIGAFQPPPLREDLGRLWENFLVVERHKRNAYRELHPQVGFWRTYDQQEIDYVEESDGKLAAYEFKWGEPGRYRVPAAFAGAYPDAPVTVVTPRDVEDFIGG